MVGLDNPIHLLFLLVILLLIFGAKRLPEMGRSMGTGLRGFKEAISGEVPAEGTDELAPAAPTAAFSEAVAPEAVAPAANSTAGEPPVRSAA
jgi:sec-independent protein translocase protein TatA